MDRRAFLRSTPLALSAPLLRAEGDGPPFGDPILASEINKILSEMSSVDGAGVLQVLGKSISVDETIACQDGVDLHLWTSTLTLVDTSIDPIIQVKKNRLCGGKIDLRTHDYTGTCIAAGGNQLFIDEMETLGVEGVKVVGAPSYSNYIGLEIESSGGTNRTFFVEFKDLTFAHAGTAVRIACDDASDTASFANSLTLRGIYCSGRKGLDMSRANANNGVNESKIWDFTYQSNAQSELAISINGSRNLLRGASIIDWRAFVPTNHAIEFGADSFENDVVGIFPSSGTVVVDNSPGGTNTVTNHA